ncbi:MAG: D-alanyl-D-alanine carboxypeptidase [Clostridia bacterium]|nr:D-alanyl-D-alanine carboxypeptidase [Clostridia bacterium]
MKRILISFFSIILALLVCVPCPLTNALAPSVSGGGIILMDANSKHIFYEKDIHKKRPMASTTKIMTVLLTIESGNLEREITFTRNMIAEGSNMGLKVGDKVSLYSLCVGMMLSSGNDAANAAAISVGGNIENFCKLMNQKAKDLGMKNTSFETPSGLDGEHHYSTSYDMALLAIYAMKNDTFKKLASAKSMKISFGTPKRECTYYNHNKLLSSYKGAVGVKTGFTKKSGRCLVSMAERDGASLVCVTLNTGDDWNVHKKLFDFGFEQFTDFEAGKDISLSTLPLVGGEKCTVDILIEEKIIKIPKDLVEKVKLSVQVEPFVYAPTYKGDVVGEYFYHFEGREIFRGMIYLNEDITLKPCNPVKLFFERLFYSFRRML